MNEPGEQYDLLIIGAGSAGFAAARTAAAEYGARTALIDKGPVGGLCILAGCMPSKALTQVAHLAYSLGEAERFGLSGEGCRVDFPAVMARKNRFIRRLARLREQDIRDLPRTDFVRGEARFLSDHRVSVGSRVLSAPRVILAAGSVPVLPPIPGLVESRPLLSGDILSLKSLPSSLAVIGGGMVAMELGQFCRRLGVRVTVLEAAPQLLPREDADAAAVLTACLAREGMKIHTGVRVESVEAAGNSKRIHYLENGKRHLVEASELLVATGRVPDLAPLDLKRAGVEVENGRLLLDSCLRTSVPHIFAAGDMVGGSYTVHSAIVEGEAAARNALSDCATAIEPKLLPLSVAFTEPNVARVGLTESEAAAQGRPVVVGRADFITNGKAWIVGRTEGFVKILADPDSGMLLGGTVIGEQAAELIHELACAVSFKMTARQMAAVPHVHPTLAESFPDALAEINSRLRGPQ